MTAVIVCVFLLSIEHYSSQSDEVPRLDGIGNSVSLSENVVWDPLELLPSDSNQVAGGLRPHPRRPGAGAVAGVLGGALMGST